MAGPTLQQTVALQRLKVVVNGGRRRELYRLGDLAHGRRVTPLARRRGDEFDDALLPSGVMLGHRRLLPQRP
jgi:hypothetical protein